MKPTPTASAPKQQLARSLGLWSIVGLGLGYMTLTSIFDTFGIVSDKTSSVVPSAYLLALVVMMFTAISYGRMTLVFPPAVSWTWRFRTVLRDLELRSECARAGQDEFLYLLQSHRHSRDIGNHPA